MLASSVIVHRSESCRQVAENQIELFYPKLRVLDSQSSSSGENCTIWYSAICLKLSERGTIMEEANSCLILRYLIPHLF